MKKIIPLILITLLTSGCVKDTNHFVIALNKYDQPLSFLTEPQRNYYLDSTYKNINDYTKNLSSKTDDAKPLPITIDWDVETNYKDYHYEFVYSRSVNFTDYKTITTTETSVDLYNLLIDEEYFYRIDVLNNEEELIMSSGIGSFKTEDLGLRNIYIETLSNIRDLGSLRYPGGGRAKQGLLYRSAGLNEAYTDNITVSEEDIAYMREELGIRSEIDLRNNAETSKGVETGRITVSPLGEDINYYQCPMLYGGTNILRRSENQESIKQFFELLADENNYPILFHCSQGKDRTGGLAYVIGALLGVDNDTLLRDYLFTNFSNVGTVEAVGITGSGMIGGYISREEGDSLEDKAYNYLIRENEIPAETLDKIIEILG